MQNRRNNIVLYMSTNNVFREKKDHPKGINTQIKVDYLLFAEVKIARAIVLKVMVKEGRSMKHTKNIVRFVNMS